MKRETKLYNLIFPIWLLVFIPWLVFPAAALNFGIDTLVLLLTLRHLGVTPKKTVWKKSIIRVVIFGFLGDIAGAPAMIGIDAALSAAGFHNIDSALMYDPWSHIAALCIAIGCMVFASFVIYKLDKRFAFNKTDLTDIQKKTAALSLAVFTTPILFIVPTKLFFRYY